MDKIIEGIAAEFLGIYALAEVGIDHLDFREVHVSALRKALEKAYLSGFGAGNDPARDLRK